MDCEREELIETLSKLIKCDPVILRDFPIGLPNLKIPTLGGFIFWEDVAEIEGWRMQRNMFTGHWRLLDPRNIRCAWGTDEKMVDIFTRASQAKGNDEGEVIGEQEGDDVSPDSPSINVDTEVKEADINEEI